VVEAGQHRGGAVGGGYEVHRFASATPVAPAAAPLQGNDPDPIADLAGGDTVAHRDDLTNTFVPQRQRRRAEGEFALGEPYVGTANPAGVHLHQHLAAADLRNVDLAHLPFRVQGGDD
jgi:hypothetical protein